MEIIWDDMIEFAIITLLSLALVPHHTRCGGRERMENGRENVSCLGMRWGSWIKLKYTYFYYVWHDMLEHWRFDYLLLTWRHSIWWHAPHAYCADIDTVFQAHANRLCWPIFLWKILQMIGFVAANKFGCRTRLAKCKLRIKYLHSTVCVRTSTLMRGFHEHFRLFSSV